MRVLPGGRNDLETARKILMVVLAIVSPIATGMGLFYKSQSDTEAKINAIHLEMAEGRLYREQNFARKEDLKPLQTKIDEVSKDVIEIKAKVNTIAAADRKPDGFRVSSASILSRP